MTRRRYLHDPAKDLDTYLFAMTRQIAQPSYIRAYARTSDHVLFYHIAAALILSYYIDALTHAHT